MDIKKFLKFDFKKSATVSGLKVQFSFQYALIAVALIVAALDLYVLQAAARKVWSTRTEEVGARQIVSTRVNFSGYDKALQRIEGASTFVPKQAVTTNPFAKPEK